MTAAVTSYHNASGFLRIYINEKLHLAFSTARLAGIQSWTLSHTRTPATYAIEITPIAGKRVVAEYDDADLWCDVLSHIDRTFGSRASTPAAIDGLAPGGRDGTEG